MSKDDKENLNEYGESCQEQGFDKKNGVIFSNDYASDVYDPVVAEKYQHHERSSAQPLYERYAYSYESHNHESNGDSDWMVPSVPIESPSTSPLKELKNLANQEAQNFLPEGGKYCQENIFDPPNSPTKDPFDYLKEIAGSEAFKLQRIKKELKRDERKQYAASNHYAAPHVTDMYNLDGRSFGNEIPDNLSSPTCDRIKPVKSFNDFDEGIFVFNERTSKYMCPDPSCSKEFPSLSRIKRHFIIHTNIKPFKCQNKECDRTFSRKDNMLQHYRVHCPYSNFR